MKPEIQNAILVYRSKYLSLPMLILQLQPHETIMFMVPNAYLPGFAWAVIDFQSISDKNVFKFSVDCYISSVAHIIIFIWQTGELVVGH